MSEKRTAPAADYDQFVNIAAGPNGTNLIGYLRIMGGIILEDRFDPF